MSASDIRVGDWSIPWNTRHGVGRLGPGIPKSDFIDAPTRGFVLSRTERSSIHATAAAESTGSYADPLEAGE